MVPQPYLYQRTVANEKRRPGSPRRRPSVSQPGKRQVGSGLLEAFGCSSGFLFGVLAAQEVQPGGLVCGRKFRGFRQFLDRGRSGHFREQLDAAVVLESGARRNQSAHDHVFLQAAQVVHLPGHSRFREYARGLLEASRGDERVGRKRRLGDAKEQRAAGSRTPTCRDHPIVFLAEAELVHLLFQQERRVAHILHLHPAHHLSRDGLDVFVVDVHTLQPVDLLNRIDQVGLGVLLAQHRQQIVQVQRSVDERFARSHVLAFLYVDVHAAWDGIFLRSLAIFALDVDFAHALADFAVTDDAVDLADYRGVLRLPRLEQFHHARQTARDVLGLRRFARDLRQHVARLHLIAVLHHQVRARRHQVLLADLAGGIADQDRGLVLLVARRQGNDELRQSGDFVHLLFDRQTRAQVVKLHRAGRLRQDREREGIPFRQDLPVVDRIAVVHAQTRAIHHVVALLFAALLIQDGNEPGPVHGNQRSAAALNVAQVNELDHAVVLGFERRPLAHTRSRSTDVERTHGKLRARFANGLCGDDTHGLAKLYHASGREVAPITQSADSAARFAREHRTDAHPLDTGGLDGVGQFFADFLVDFDNDVAFEVLDAFERNAAHDAVAQRLDFDARFDNGFDEDAIGCAAVVLVDDYVLCHVDQAAGQVTRVGRLQRRIGKTLTGAVRRDEVLQHREAFAEVGGNGRLDDFP